MTETAMGFLGIMTGRRRGNPPIAEPEFCSQLCRVAPLYDLQVLIFHPEGVARDGQSIRGYIWNDGQWQPTLAAPPDILYNRCLYSSLQEKDPPLPPWLPYPGRFRGRVVCLINGASMKFYGAAAELQHGCPRPDFTPVPVIWTRCLQKERTAFF